MYRIQYITKYLVRFDQVNGQAPGQALSFYLGYRISSSLYIATTQFNSLRQAFMYDLTWY
jgi:hypothetical protein